MKSKLMFLGAIASLALPHAIRAQEISTPLASIISSGVAARIACHGSQGIPLTADAEQTLPMQLVATLSCGDDIFIISDAEGYTMNVRTMDGKTGYVAAMYVTKVPKARQAAAVHLESAAVVNGTARWQAGAKGCDQFQSDGALVESLTVNGVTVQVSLHDTGWKMRADVAVANDGTHVVAVVPAHFILDDTAKTLAYQDPEHLAKNMTHQILWTEASARPSDARFMNAAYKVPADSRTSAPNYLAQHQFAADEAVRSQANKTLVNTAEQVNSLALRATTVDPQNKVAGSVWFNRDKNPTRLVLRVPVESMTFEFPLSFN